MAPVDSESVTLSLELARLSRLVADGSPALDQQPTLVARARSLAAEIADVLVGQRLSTGRARHDLEPVRLQIMSLGAFHVAWDGTPLPPCRAVRAVTVLRYLLAKPRGEASKGELAEAIWGGTDVDHAGHSLHVAVSTLRQYLDRGRQRVVQFDAGRYSLNRSIEITHDVAVFDDELSAAEGSLRRGDIEAAERHYAQAVAWYGGDYCVQDLDQPWAALERERLIARFHLSLERLGVLQLRRRNSEAAVKHLKILVTREPYREDIHHSLMIGYLLMGRRNDALQQFRTCCVALEDELALAPDPKLRRLHERVLASDSSDDIDPADWLWMAS